MEGVKEKVVNERRKLLVCDDAIAAATAHFIESAQTAIAKKGTFTVALSGGSTPKKIYQLLSQKYKGALDWTKVYLFWSDERSVPPTDPESNYHMAMVEGGLNTLGIPEKNIFRMVAENEIEKNAALYEKTIDEVLKGAPFDLIMLGLGEDGHTASLFPKTEALYVVNCEVAANHVPQKNTWRMTLTFECINRASEICLYVLGPSKADILHHVLTAPFSPDDFPIQRVGTKTHPLLILTDPAAAAKL